MKILQWLIQYFLVHKILHHLGEHLAKVRHLAVLAARLGERLEDLRQVRVATEP